MENGKVKIQKSKVLSDDWYTLKKYTYDYRMNNGEWETRRREVYDRGNGSAILLYNQEKGTVILTRQFRMPTFVNGNQTGMLIEIPAGLLDFDHPEAAIIRETEEETGYRVKSVKKVFEAYMSPGSVTEILYCFVAAYDESMKVHNGGGVDQEEIEVMEMPFEDALAMIEDGRICDGKTIMLLQYAQLKNLLSG